MPIKLAVKIVRLKVYTTLAIPMTLTFSQGHKCVSNLTIFLTCNISYLESDALPIHLPRHPTAEVVTDLGRHTSVHLS